MKSAKLTAAAATVLLAAAACGGSSEPERGGGTDPDQLTVWMMGEGSPEQTAFLEDVAQQFQQEHPDTEVTVQYVPWPQASRKFQNALVGGQGPDVTEVGNTQVQSWATQGAFADITNLMNDWQNTQDFVQTALANDEQDGKYYAMPWYGGVRGVWYRADWFEELDIEIPQTWDQLVDAAETIQREKGVPGIGAPSDFTNGIVSFIWGAGGELAVEQGGEWVVGIDEPAAKEGITFYIDLVSEYGVAPKKYIGKNELEGPQRDFALGELGMYMDGPWALPQLTDIAEDDKEHWASFPIPSADGGPAPVFSGGSDLAVWADSEHKAVAFDYLTVLNSKQNAQTFADQLGFFPQYVDLLSSEKYQNDPIMAGFAEAATNTKMLPQTPNWVEADDNKKVLPNAVQDIMQGAPVDSTLTEAAETMETLLNQD